MIGCLGETSSTNWKTGSDPFPSICLRPVQTHNWRHTAGAGHSSPGSGCHTLSLGQITMHNYMFPPRIRPDHPVPGETANGIRKRSHRVAKPIVVPYAPPEPAAGLLEKVNNSL